MEEPFKMDVVSVRLVKDAPIFSEKQITKPEHAVELLGKIMCEFDREVVCVLNMRNDGIPINCSFASIGAINMALMEPREIFKAAILSNAANMILIHNHPSGSLKPSQHDTNITDRMISLSRMMGIELLDHIIVGGDNSQYFSFREKGLMDCETIRYESDYHQLQFDKKEAESEKERGR